MHPMLGKFWKIIFLQTGMIYFFQNITLKRLPNGWMKAMIKASGEWGTTNRQAYEWY